MIMPEPRRTITFRQASELLFVMTSPTDHPEAAAWTPALVELTERQRLMVSVLQDKDQSLAQMYIGALHARSATENPDSISQASHSIREVIGQLPNFFSVPIPAPGVLKSKVNEIHEAWRKQKIEPSKAGVVLEPKFAKKLADFFDWHAENYPKMREVARQAVREFDASRRILPERIETDHAEEWLKVRNIFVKATHHSACTPEQFDVNLDRFERLVLGLAKPPTFATADALDALIQEIEGNA
jgi:hypothetical protein